jgi:hypothetical protein
VNKTLIRTALSMTLVFAISCGPNLPPSTPGGGFLIATWGMDLTVPNPQPFQARYITAKGEWGQIASSRAVSGRWAMPPHGP